MEERTRNLSSGDITSARFPLVVCIHGFPSPNGECIHEMGADTSAAMAAATPAARMPLASCPCGFPSATGFCEH